MIYWLEGKALNMSLKDEKLYVNGLNQYDKKTLEKVKMFIEICKPELIEKIKTGFEEIKPELEQRKYCNDSMPCNFLKGNTCIKTGQQIDFEHVCPISKSRFYKFIKTHNKGKR